MIMVASCGEATDAAKDAVDKTTEAASKAGDAVKDAVNVKMVKATVDVNKSKVQWKGEMLGVYAHQGVLSLSSGNLELAGDKITGGSFVVDMKSMRATDNNYDPAEGKTKEGLVGHLSSPDFFDVANHQSATFKISSVSGTNATGQMTIKGITNEETIKDVSINKKGDALIISGSLTIDRQKYGVVWAHPVKENVLSDDIVLGIKMTASI